MKERTHHFLDLNYIFSVLLLLISVFSPCNVVGSETGDGHSSNILVVADVDLANCKLGLNSSETEASYTVTSNIYDTLLELNEKGEIIPSLAREWEIVDKKTVRLYLRDDVIFHNGHKMDEYDVKKSLEYFVGKNLFSSKMLDSIERVDVVKPYCVDVKLKREDSLFLRRLAFWARIFPIGTVKESDLGRLDMDPVGSGPYRLDRYRSSQSVAFRKNDNYWKKDFPLYETVELRYVASPKERLKIVENGAADVVTNIEATDLSSLLKEPGYYIFKIPALYSVFGIFNIDKPNSPLKDVNVRKAINYALNRDVLTRLILKGNGIALASLSLEKEIGHNAELKPYEYNIGLAKRLLKEAGYAGGLQLMVGLQSDLTMSSTYSKFIEASLGEIGIKLIFQEGFTLRMISEPNRDPSLKAWEGDILLGGDPSPYGHFDFLLSNFFIRDALYKLVTDDKIEKAYEKAQAEYDLKKQTDLYEFIDEYIYKQSYALFSHQSKNIYAIRKGLQYSPSNSGLLEIKKIKESKYED